jgi:alkylhydroperoxidase/carboxymuconolactone decarboxylase family protein YurZ
LQCEADSGNIFIQYINFLEEKQMPNKYPDFISALEKNDSKLFESVTGIYDISMNPGELDVNTKILIAMSLDAFVGSSDGVKALSNIARKMGITEGQISEALRIAYFIAGNPVLEAIHAAYED